MNQAKGKPWKASSSSARSRGILMGSSAERGAGKLSMGGRLTVWED